MSEHFVCQKCQRIYDEEPHIVQKDTTKDTTSGDITVTAVFYCNTCFESLSRKPEVIATTAKTFYS